jgi:hypothetical protein
MRFAVRTTSDRGRASTLVADPARTSATAPTAAIRPIVLILLFIVVLLRSRVLG